MFQTSIVNLFKNSKSLSIVLLLFIWLASSGFQMPTSLENILNKIPYLNKIMRPENPPKELEKETQKYLEKAYWEGAPIYAKELWQKAQDYYQKGQKALAQKNYSHAKFYFGKAKEIAQKAEKESLTKRQELKKQAKEKLNKFLELHPELNQSLEGQLKIKLLKELIEAEKFDEFNKEIKNLAEKLDKKRGIAPPPPKATSQ